MRHAQRPTTLPANGPALDAAAVLYDGEVMHARLKPFGHRFSYRVVSLLVDVDRLAEVGRESRLFGVNRPGLFSFYESDHAERPGETVRAFADRLLAVAGLEKRASRILLLAYPRMLGYVFNPISVYFAYGDDGDILALIYAVRNTFGQRHTYVAPVREGDLGAAGIRQSRGKRLHVSPFMDMEARYHFRVLPPGRSVRLRIHETEGAEPVLAATFVGDAVPFSTATLTAWLIRFPWMTLKVMAAIHWQALKLWVKGARFRTSPPAPSAASYGDENTLEAAE